jgi:hypothetical protein
LNHRERQDPLGERSRQVVYPLLWRAYDEERGNDLKQVADDPACCLVALYGRASLTANDLVDADVYPQHAMFA